MKIALICVAVLAVVVAAIYVWGCLLPVGHETKISRIFGAPPDFVFARISDFKSYPQWRTGVKTVDLDGAHRFIEDSSGHHGKIPYKIKINEIPSRLVIEIDDPKLPFSGTWTFEISSHLSGATLTITERGKTKNPLGRLMHKYYFSHEKTINTYLDDLAKLTGAKI